MRTTNNPVEMAAKWIGSHQCDNCGANNIEIGTADILLDSSKAVSFAWYVCPVCKTEQGINPPAYVLWQARAMGNKIRVENFGGQFDNPYEDDEDRAEQASRTEVVEAKPFLRLFALGGLIFVGVVAFNIVLAIEPTMKIPLLMLFSATVVLSMLFGMTSSK